MGIAFIVSAWVARYLGPNRFGELNYIFAYLAFFLSVATLGLDGVVVRDLSVDRFEANEILGSSFVLRLIARSQLLDFCSKRTCDLVSV